jgi:hypothetical protein
MIKPRYGSAFRAEGFTPQETSVRETPPVQTSHHATRVPPLPAPRASSAQNWRNVCRRDEEDRREVNPPIEVDAATWSAEGQLDYWVKERREWFGCARGRDGRQVWIKAADLRPAKECG